MPGRNGRRRARGDRGGRRREDARGGGGEKSKEV